MFRGTRYLTICSIAAVCTVFQILSLIVMQRVKWSHLSRDHSISYLRFPMGARLKPTFYLQRIWRY